MSALREFCDISIIMGEPLLDKARADFSSLECDIFKFDGWNKKVMIFILLKYNIFFLE